MAATRGTVQGFQKNGNPKNGVASRLGHGSVGTSAATWRTFVYTTVYADGCVSVQVVRDNEVIHLYDAGAE